MRRTYATLAQSWNRPEDAHILELTARANDPENSCFNVNGTTRQNQCSKLFNSYWSLIIHCQTRDMISVKINIGVFGGRSLGDCNSNF